uniref:TBC1 domain member 4 n=1 Tax=Sphaerodactylus townsendi TaxID=933632 RepID=A0ACB8FJL7_9SAUR
MEQAGAEPAFSHPLQEEEEEGGAAAAAAEKRFKLWYVGWSWLDRRATLPMLPWLVAEIRRRSQQPEPGVVGPREVLLLLGASPHLRCVPSAPAGGARPAVLIFEHQAQHIARFIHAGHDLAYFAYLIKAQPDDPRSQMACHVFRANHPDQKGQQLLETSDRSGLVEMPSFVNLAFGIEQTWGQETSVGEGAFVCL